MMQVDIYTDGACSGNPGLGGWGVVLLAKGERKELNGGETLTTNQRMELMAAIQGLSALKYACDVRLFSDSAYLINCFRQRWFERWQRNGWRNSKGDSVENQDLWMVLLKLATEHQIEWIKVKGHSDNEENNRCDELARAAIQKLKE
ncbi:MAG TPA: ribonuclease HI [Bacillota bacterium]|nr:ribonuclease HI [Bacillota bacterium]